MRGHFIEVVQSWTRCWLKKSDVFGNVLGVKFVSQSHMHLRIVVVTFVCLDCVPKTIGKGPERARRSARSMARTQESYQPRSPRSVRRQVPNLGRASPSQRHIGARS